MDTEKVLDQFAKTNKLAAGAVKEWTIGQHVVALLAEEGEISISALVASLQRVIDSSQSAAGKKEPEQDLLRLQAEAALDHIRGLTGRSD